MPQTIKQMQKRHRKRKGNDNENVNVNNNANGASINVIPSITPKKEQQKQQNKFGFNHIPSTPQQVFEWLIAPIPIETFINEYWEHKPLYIPRSSSTKQSQSQSNSNYYEDLYSKAALFNYIRKNENNHEKEEEDKIRYAGMINVCKYVDGVKINGNLMEEMDSCDDSNDEEDDDESDEPISTGKEVTVQSLENLFLREGYTIQAHHPQHYSHPVAYLLSKLESFFQCLCGANAYFTPADAQGLSPHHDDVEVFVLQLEGEKEWTLYEPIVELARVHSKDFDHSEIGEPIAKYTLRPGDMLYFPRGTIHEAHTHLYSHLDAAKDKKGRHTSWSTHLTISTYQQQSMLDLMRLSVNRALMRMWNARTSIQPSLRSGLPIGLSAWMGTRQEQSIVMSQMSANNRQTKTQSSKKKEHKAKGTTKELGPNSNFMDKMNSFAEQMVQVATSLPDFMDVSNDVDVFSRSFLTSRLPPIPRSFQQDSFSSSSFIPKEFNGSPEERYSEGLPPIPGFDENLLIRLRHPGHITFQVVDGKEEEEFDNMDANNDRYSNGSSEDESEVEEYSDDDDDGDQEDAVNRPSNRMGSKRSTTTERESENVDDEDMEGDDEITSDDSGYVLVIHSLHNVTSHHLDGRYPPPPNSSLKLQLHSLPILSALVNSADAFISVDELFSAVQKMDENITKEHVYHTLASLWSTRLLESQLSVPTEENLMLSKAHFHANRIETSKANNSGAHPSSKKQKRG